MVFCSIAAKEGMRKSGNRFPALLRSDEYLKHVMPFLKVWFRMYSYRVSCYIVCQISICCMVLTNFVFKCHNHDGINDDVTITGGHLGRDKTYHKIAERFYWKSLWRDVTDYIKTCEVCQTTNDAKFVKEAAPLHPIPVKPEVWRQVQHYCGHALITVH